jgi:hypothetical protein
LRAELKLRHVGVAYGDALAERFLEIFHTPLGDDHPEWRRAVVRAFTFRANCVALRAKALRNLAPSFRLFGHLR